MARSLIEKTRRVPGEGREFVQVREGEMKVVIVVGG
jgi:hypothetical protein